MYDISILVHTYPFFFLLLWPLPFAFLILKDPFSHPKHPFSLNFLNPQTPISLHFLSFLNPQTPISLYFLSFYQPRTPLSHFFPLSLTFSLLPTFVCPPFLISIFLTHRSTHDNSHGCSSSS